MSSSTLTFTERHQLSSVLETLADNIDLTETQYQDAIDRYEAVGGFLSHPAGSLAIYKPRLVPQGSFRIGTVVRPDDDDCEFDVDTTCWLNINLPTQQKHIKSLIGNRLRSHETYRKMLEEKHRCWRLIYHESSHFHLDVVPAIPDSYEWLLMLGVPEQYAKHAIRITDNRHPLYDVSSSELPRSNPEGYALWFLDVMKIQADKIRNRLAMELKLSIDKIPDYKIRTPLQRSIQIMKRHRDQIYGADELKPISIIITTLAARSYENIMRRQSFSTEFYDIVLKIVEEMPNYIQSRNGIKWIPNPVNPNENFADKWGSDARLERRFYDWHGKLLDLLQGDEMVKGLKMRSELLEHSFGRRAVRNSFNQSEELPLSQLEKLQSTSRVLQSGAAFTNALGHITTNDSGVKNQPHRFHLNNDPEKTKS